MAGTISTAAATSATPVDIAAVGLVAEPTESASIATYEYTKTEINKPEDQVNIIPHGGITMPTGAVPADVENDEILPTVANLARQPESPKIRNNDIAKNEKLSPRQNAIIDEKADVKLQFEDSPSSPISEVKEKPYTTPQTPFVPQNKFKDLSASDAGLAPGKKREKWFQIWRPKNGPRKPPTSLDDAQEIPLATASYFSRLTFSWVSPLMVLGYQRPLQATDLWKMDASRESGPLSDKFLAVYKARKNEATAYNSRLNDHTITPSAWKRFKWNAYSTCSSALPSDFANFGEGGRNTRKQRYMAYENEWRQRSGRKQASIIWALNDVLTGFWGAGIFKVLGDTSQMMTPLVTKQLIRHANNVYTAHKNGTPQPSIGPGVGMAFGLFFLTILASICNHQFFFLSMSTGVMARATLITATYKQTVALTVRERAQHPSGKIMSHLSADISRIDYCAQWFHAVWTAPIQLLVCLVLLLVNIGPSALVGMSLFLIILPLQAWAMKLSYKVRQKSMKYTDARSRSLQELLSSMQLIKMFTYERPFLKRMFDLRAHELIGIRISGRSIKHSPSVYRSWLQLVRTRTLMYIKAFTQALDSVPFFLVTFACYAGIGHNLQAAEVFTSLSWFMLLRQPLMFLPRALSSLSDAQSALFRISPLFNARTTNSSIDIDPELPEAVKVENATFEWVSGPSEEALTKTDKKSSKKIEKVDTHVSEEQPFRLDNINLNITRGSIVAIVGPIGSGKSSLLQGILGDMEHLCGTVKFGGSVGYASQQAWIQNLSVKENITSFASGREFNESEYWAAVKAAALPADLELLPDGDGTEIGERGVNLSGGQKQRLNIARVLYRSPDIAFFDDVLSALDAHVGQYVFDNALMGLKAKGKTVVMVTHAVHLLDRVDYIYTMNNGQIAEQGTFEELMSKGQEGAFRRLIDEFGGMDAKSSEEEEVLETIPTEVEGQPSRLAIKRQITEKMISTVSGSGKLEGRLMIPEVRKSGRVGSKIYGEYLRAAKAVYTAPLLLLCVLLMQGAQISSTLFLTWWENDTFGKSVGFYTGVYGALGVAQALFTFAVGISTGVLCLFASSSLFQMALKALFFAPMTTFDTTPLGRLMGILTKDVDSVDNQLADSWRMFIITAANTLGSVVIITVFLHYFIAVIVAVAIGYLYFASYYRASAREVKRLDSMTRSLLYSHFSESLSGLATIRAFAEEKRFTHENCFYTDLEDRAYLLTSANQRWLSIRLDCVGAILSFSVAMMAAKGASGLTAGQVGLTLTYMTTLVQQLGMVVRQSAELENNMNAVERVLQNAKLPNEKPYEIAETEPPKEWPSRGSVRFNECVLSYRAGLPPALKGISLEVAESERLGVIGRTGAGKSSLTVALYRLVELVSGSIEIDGVDISKIGLKDLRSKLAIIPQDPRLFAGTIRSCLDPFEEYDDSYLHDAMRRASLLESTVQNHAEGGIQSRAKFTLDTPLDEEGSNLSVGERSLVSLARALVKNAKITILDEATASIDLMTDQVIQETINRDFANTTLICIAHRLRTIIGWDRIAVMDAGRIAEIAPPLELFDSTDGIFRSLCDKSSITRAEIERAQVQTKEQRQAKGVSVDLN